MALQEDATLPVLCHTMHWHGDMEDGFTLDLNHPMTPGVPTLFVGATYLRRYNGKGCLYVPKADETLGRVRRASLRSAPMGEFTNYFLAEPTRAETTHLVYVDLNPPAGVTFKVPFWIGVEARGIKCSSNDEHLIELRAGDTAHVFLRDGQVRRITHNGTLTGEKLPFEQQAHLRIEQMKSLLKSAEKEKQIDYALHQLINILQKTSKLSETIGAGIVRYVRDYERTHGLRPTVAQRLRTVIGTIKPSKPGREKPRQATTALAAALERAFAKQK